MIRSLLLMSLCLLSTASLADKPVGFLWYNKPLPPKEHKPHGVPFQALSYTDKDAVLKYYTMEALHKVRFTHKLEDERKFLALQSFWLREASFHGKINQMALRYYPQYDFSVTHPTSNIGVQLTDRLGRSNTQKTLRSLAKTHGLLFFYRGKNAFDAEQIPIVTDFCRQHHFTLLPVSVDGVRAASLPETKLDKGQTDKLNIHYFPALLLINPKAHTSIPIAFGLTTQDVLATRLTAIASGGSL